MNTKVFSHMRFPVTLLKSLSQFSITKLVKHLSRGSKGFLTVTFAFLKTVTILCVMLKSTQHFHSSFLPTYNEGGKS